jgi:hypothetical protein
MAALANVIGQQSTAFGRMPPHHGTWHWMCGIDPKPPVPNFRFAEVCMRKLGGFLEAIQPLIFPI